MKIFFILILCTILALNSMGCKKNSSDEMSLENTDEAMEQMEDDTTEAIEDDEESEGEGISVE